MMKARRTEWGYTKKKKQEGREAEALGVGSTLYPRAYTLDHRWAFLCFLVGRFTEHFRRTDLFQRAVGPGVSVLRVWSLGWAWTGAFGKWRHGKQRSSQGFCTPNGIPFFSSFLLLHLHLLFLLPITLPFLTHLVLKTHHVLRFTPSLEVDQLVPLRGKGDRDQPGSKRYPASNTTNDAGIGQKRKHPHTAAAVAAAPVTRPACGLGSAHVAYGAAPGALEKSRPSPVFGNHEPRHQPTNQPISSIM